VPILVVVGVIVVLGLALLGWYKGGYEKLVGFDEETNSAWAQVENQLQRRFDLIPNLVNTVKGYAEHEKEVLTAVTEARARVGSAQTIPDKIDANRQLTSALGRLMVVMENYPNLKADQSFIGLQAQLEGTENRIAVERRRYNEAVKNYNTAIRGFFVSFIARNMGLERKPFFEADQAAQAAPKVEF
jgi:LemA protein